jgi:hypothetical protein
MWLRRAIASLLAALMLTGIGMFAGSANAATGGIIQPAQARQIAVGLIDANGTLGIQCGLGMVGDKIKAGSVAADAAKASLKISGAKDSCKGVKQLAEGILVIVALTDFNQPVYISLSQSEKNKWWGAGVIKTCGVTLRVGASASVAKDFKASFTCY